MRVCVPMLWRSYTVNKGKPTVLMAGALAFTQPIPNSNATPGLSLALTISYHQPSKATPEIDRSDTCSLALERGSAEPESSLRKKTACGNAEDGSAETDASVACAAAGGFGRCFVLLRCRCCLIVSVVCR